jgi:hypothetical protein
LWFEGERAAVSDDLKPIPEIIHLEEVAQEKNAA